MCLPAWGHCRYCRPHGPVSAGWTILKDFSLEHLWFFPALQPWGEPACSFLPAGQQRAPAATLAAK